MNKSNEPQTDATDFVIGRHAAHETLQTEGAKRVNKVFIQEGLKSDSLHALQQLAKAKRIPVQSAPKNKLDTLSDHGNHQGVVLAITPYAYAELDDLFARAEAKQQPPFFLMLDGIEDPHNLGSIMRTADAVGVHGIIIPKHRAVGLTSTVAKTSTGAIEHIPVVRATNLVAVAKELKQRGVWLFGTDMAGTDYRKWNAKGAITLVIGNEGKGIAPLLKREMDEVVTIPMIGHVQSLNASVATGLLLYQAYAVKQGSGELP
ncbi:23S rRNA (guanosine(2251)-2'-O)-methyltransferase RlmB [Loigolactobacillus coryniformis]|jgi:23S rRNA (guanosine2251-2'-O)-methyltransferase|uniref:23S rRNA (Guanosine(2251)-2'-O)-methyltransferase RlmB n=1 Tax=Loigolactobacillus coryniformis TaxID=1610 RepID=A0A5B8TQR9_9LACO|nr:23S rRNA (guanosine(2251)-2'-O)-methyltransferase RlmB [Loigolactobacillus coryniformis]MDT3392119.1 23S rRNA (guanosine(2251)-2'-O)-methyltransferase RlmB [Bacillota bacterium]RRG06701.1 MAG: 23S rRNA (guanosine(2251)-2'-O)-methyltransferase RlmB [Lactobacillus sp.]MBW4802096.1 23S rRNA (guanosine(2251)-2'-O)-methyltransferase RlmB [Loigolactobacillus coryniformis subsp. torquens]MBW4804811.1 23S rRNA (guanosine(2251)-2'-O)-methyltransferase RlmB [Loigolactobacillus coryniformis subsp. torq